MASFKPTHRALTSTQQEELRGYFQQRLAAYRRPDIGGFGTAERTVSHFRCEYEHMPLIEFWRCARIDGNYHVIRQQVLPRGHQPYYATPILLGRDVLNAARVWRQERDRWVQQWLAEAQEKFGLQQLPPAEGTNNNIYGHKVPGVPVQWLEATWEWPAMDWRRDTPGVFEVYEDDLNELRVLPENLDGVGSCEPEEFAVMKLPNLAALSRIILALYDSYGPNSILTQSREVEKEEDEWHTLIAFDCRSWLKAEVEQEGAQANG
jgi:hypothetical protein